MVRVGVLLIGRACALAAWRKKGLPRRARDVAEWDFRRVHQWAIEERGAAARLRRFGWRAPAALLLIGVGALRALYPESA